MPQEPKKRHSRQRQGKRRAAISLRVTNNKHRLNRFYALLEKKKQAPQKPKAQEKAESTPQEDTDI